MASTRTRGNSPFNLVDQFCEVAGLGPDERRYALVRPDEAARADVAALLRDLAPEGCRGFVGFQLGASADMRRWPVERFAELGALLWTERRLCPVLLGAPGEERLGERFAAQGACPSVSLIGRTSLPGLAAALTQLGLLVTNDTGTMHLAAGLGTPVCAIFLATAQPWDTGPYASGALCLEPDLPCHPCGFRHRCTIGYACRRSVRARAVYHYIRSFLDTGAWDAVAPPEPPGLRAWLTRPDPRGGLDLVSLTGHEAEDRTAWIRMQRHHYRQFLDKRPPAPLPGSVALSKSFVDKVLPVLSQSAQLLELLHAQARAVAGAPVAALKSRFLGNFERLTGLWSDSGEFSVLGDMWREQAQEAAEDMNQLGEVIDLYHKMIVAWLADVQPLAR